MNGIEDIKSNTKGNKRVSTISLTAKTVELFLSLYAFFEKRFSESAIAKLLRKFEDHGYIARKEDPENRRKKLVKMTDDGIKKTDEIIEVIQNWEEKVTSSISEDEIKTLKEILFKITMI